MAIQIIPTPPASAFRPNYRLRLSRGDARLFCEWAAIAGQAGASPFQAPDFVTAWRTARGGGAGDLVFLSAEDASGIAAILPLEVRRLGPLAIARMPGGTHANLCGPLWRAGAARQALLGAAELETVLHDGVPRIDALILERLPDTTFLGADAHIRPSFEERFAISLDGGLEAVIGRGNAKRKRKKFRQQQRHFEALGGYRFVRLAADEAPAAVEMFRALKTSRFAALGMPDPFAEPGIPAFLHALFDAGDTRYRLYAVESAGAVKAMLGGIASGSIFFGMFSAFSDDADAAVSPGELLIWHLVEALSAEGLSILDLGPGEERYKHSWCDLVIAQSDATLALTAPGRLLLRADALRGAARAAIKKRRRLLSAAQRLRRLLQRRVG